MKKIKEIHKNERPREKLLAKGAVSLSDQELLAVVLAKEPINWMYWHY